MPRNSSGLYQLPAGMTAVPNTLIESEKYNAFINDAGNELTASLPRDGRAAMTGKLGLIDGTNTSPAAQFVSAPQTGIYYDPAGPALVISIGGVEAFRVGATGPAIKLPIGMPIPVLEDVLPPLCIWADGRNVSRTTYAELFAKWGSKYGAGDGSTTFGVPDLRGVTMVGRDNLGGTDAGRLIGVPTVGADRLTTGGVIGESRHTLSTTEMPYHNHGGGTSTEGAHDHGYQDTGMYSGAFGNGITLGSSPSQGEISRTTSVVGGHAHYITPEGGGGPHNNVQLSVMVNFAIFAGA